MDITSLRKANTAAIAALQETKVVLADVQRLYLARFPASQRQQLEGVALDMRAAALHVQGQSQVLCKVGQADTELNEDDHADDSLM